MGRTAEWVVTQGRERIRAAGENADRFRLGWDDGPADGDISLLDLLNALVRVTFTKDGLTSRTILQPIAALQEDVVLGPEVLEVLEAWWDGGQGQRFPVGRTSWEDMLRSAGSYGGQGEIQFGPLRPATNRIRKWCTVPGSGPGSFKIRLWPVLREAQPTGLNITVKQAPALITSKTYDLDAILPTSIQEGLPDLLCATALARVKMVSEIPEGVIAAGRAVADLSEEISEQRDNALQRQITFRDYSRG